MRLLFVNSAWPPSWGGGEKWTVEAAAWFAQNHCAVTLVGRPESRLIAAARERGLSCIETPFGGDFNPAAIARARNIIMATRAELVIVNFNKEAWQFGLVAKRAHIPVVARHGFPLFRRAFHHRYLATRVLSKLIINAASIRDYYANLGFPTHDIDVIHNGVQIVTQHRGELRKRFQISSDTFLILAGGRLESQKRFDRVIEIAARLKPNVQNLCILIAGDGPLRDELETQIGLHGLNDSIRLIGFVPDWAEIIGDADLFLLTSDNEGTPNVLLEAMAAGVASVAFGIGAVPEIMYDELRVNCIPPGDVPSMTNRVRQLVNNSELRLSQAALMKQRVETEFGFEHSMRKFKDLFKQVMTASR